MCHGKLNRCMYDPFATFEGKLPGQECNYNYQCLSNSCSMRINDETFACEGLKENEQCTKDAECGTGLFCEQVCKPIKSIEQECSRDEECSNNMACTNKKCVIFGSIADGEVSDNSLACRSGFVKNVESENESKSICVPTPKVIN